MQTGNHVQHYLHGHQDEWYQESEWGHFVQLHRNWEKRLRKPANRCCANVGGVPVLGQRGAPQDPHCHDDHHL